MRTIVVIDDERTLPEADVHFRTAGEAVAYIAMHWVNHRQSSIFAETNYLELWLDHDLGDNGGNIWDVVRLLQEIARVEDVEEGVELPFSQIYIHSQNPVGAQMMHHALKRLYPSERLFDLPSNMNA